MKHLIHVASFSAQTNMHARNLAIVWAPNLLRSKDIESSGFNGTAAFMEVRVQSIVVEFILTHVEQLFGTGSGDGNMNSTSANMNWPTCVPEDYYRSLSYNLPNMLNHGDGPPQIRPYHTIIEFADHKRKGSLKAKKWKSIFNLGRNNDSKRKTTKQDEKDEKHEKMNLRPAKSMDSLSSVPADARDLEQRNLIRRSAKHQAALRRESLGTESKKEDAGNEFSDAGEQARMADTIDGDYEEEGQAKSEPTTPKQGRASMVATPQGRSPKTNNRNRAEKCVGVHISGPFSVTLPFHITSNLSRLTRGMECPSLNYSVLHRSSERLFSPEGQLYMGSSDTDKVRLTMVSNIDKENSKQIEPEMKEDNEQKMEANRMSLEVQDTFSFLDSQDTNPDETKTACIAEEEKSKERIVEYSADSEMLQYDLQHDSQMVEFSVEPPQDDPCTEDESEQMYFTPAGCLDSEDPMRNWRDSLEDVYLSAYDDLSPLSEESNDHYELDEGNIEDGGTEQTMKPKENEGMDDSIADGPPATTTDGQEEVLCDTQKPFGQADMDDGSSNTEIDNENQCSPQSNLSDRATSEVVFTREESDCDTKKDEIACVHEDNTDKETVVDSNSGYVNPGENLEDKDSVEDEGHVEIYVPLNLQDDAICGKEDMLELEALLLNLCPSDLPIPTFYDKHIPLVDEINHEDLDSPETQEPDLYNQEVLLINQPTVMNVDLPEVQDPQDVPLIHEFTLKNLDSPKNDEKDDILLEENMDSLSETVHVGLECAEDMNVVEDNMILKTIDNIEESQCCPSGTPVHDNPLLTADNAIHMTENVSLQEILSLLNCLETALEKPQENEASPWEEHKAIIWDQLQDTESSQCDLCLPHEMIQSDGLPDTVTMTPQAEDEGPSTHLDRSSESHLQNIQICSSKEQNLSNYTKSTVVKENTGASSINSDGSVTMKLAFSLNKVQQVKSVPVVPPKPQFAMLPPALKSKLHVSSKLSTTRDTPKSPKPDKGVGSEPIESGSDCAPIRRSSWRNATSVSFDTAMALAKERQQSQIPVRRMQTYCIGDSYDLLDIPKMETPPNFPKFTIKSASSRTHRPLSCMSLSSAEADFRGLRQEDPNALSIHGAQSLFQQEAEVYTKELPQRNRLSMPRIGRQSTDDVHLHTCYHQRRSLL
ncbi:PREDICTED: rho GTPase-activating protein 30 [Nanorana parkeri]|uniref:rho GTPase-activating protein 30 n=1 Tax=Nanorana parkeri TaxID=125878 RepID=UPI0008548FD7|nr:PREDICTED: rho GTPase-activating protein 30 [Nanorana parkeri]